MHLSLIHLAECTLDAVLVEWVEYAIVESEPTIGVMDSEALSFSLATSLYVGGCPNGPYAMFN